MKQSISHELANYKGISIFLMFDEISGRTYGYTDINGKKIGANGKGNLSTVYKQVAKSFDTLFFGHHDLKFKKGDCVGYFLGETAKFYGTIIGINKNPKHKPYTIQQEDGTICYANESLLKLQTK